MAFQLFGSPATLRIAVLAHLHHPIRAPFAGGMESHTAHLVAGLASRGHSVRLFAKEGSDEFDVMANAELEPMLPESYVVRGYPDDDLTNMQHQILDGAMQSAIDRIHAGNFDVVINNSLSPVPHEQLQDIPTFHILHTPPLPRIVRVLEQQGNPHTRHLFATVSSSNARAWKTWIPQLHIIENGIDIASWSSARETSYRSGLASWSGRITPEKGPHIAITAARAAGMQLVMAGPIQDQEYFDKLIAPGLDEQIQYRGHLTHTELSKMISMSEVFLSTPLWEEPFGLTTLEAMACGTPVAALPSGAMAGLIGPTGGAVAERCDTASLVEAIERARTLDRDAVFQRAAGFSHDRMLDSYEQALVVIALKTSAENRRR